MPRKTIILSAAAIALSGGMVLAGETVTEQRTYEHRSMAVEVPPPPPPATEKQTNSVEQHTTRRTGDGSVEEHSTYESTRSNVERAAPPPPRVIEKKTEVLEHEDD
ncbi:MAG: hypothetical protein KIT14_05225 [bacterium]|nr:hypothetical protein [bacterium]